MARADDGRHGRGSHGFSLLECLVSLALLSVVMAVLLPAIVRGMQLARLQPDVVDLDQRLRVAHAAIQRALEEAGAGTVSAPLSASLAGRMPVVFPARRAVTGGDLPEAAYADRLSILRIREDGWDAPLAASMSFPTSPLMLAGGPPCPIADDRCGFRPGDLAVLGDRTGAFDLLEVASAAAGIVEHAPAALSQPYLVEEHARLGRARMRQFSFDPGRRQIRLGDGLNNDLPMLDSVSSFACTYYGLALPPLEPRPALGTTSCLFNADGSSRLAALPASGAEWVELPLTSFRDGPFCGSGIARYDADLLRIRRVVVLIRVGAPATASHQETSELRALAGEREVVVDVVLRNLDPR
jgi:prepilin-type N-terminal cleavage/methylation domain-containing protein